MTRMSTQPSETKLRKLGQLHKIGPATYRLLSDEKTEVLQDYRWWADFKDVLKPGDVLFVTCKPRPDTPGTVILTVTIVQGDYVIVMPLTQVCEVKPQEEVLPSSDLDELFARSASKHGLN